MTRAAIAWGSGMRPRLGVSCRLPDVSPFLRDMACGTPPDQGHPPFASVFCSFSEFDSASV